MISYAQNMAKLLQHSRQFYYLTTDPEGIFIHVNQHFKQRFSPDSTELPGISLIDTIYSPDRDKALSTLREAEAEPGVPFSVELLHNLVSGHAISIRWELNLVEVYEERSSKIQWIGFEIGSGKTQHEELTGEFLKANEEGYKKIAEEKIRHLASLVENTTDILTSADAEFKVITLNKAAEKIYGLTLEQVYGKNPAEFLDISYNNTNREAVRNALAIEGEWRGEMHFRRFTDQKPTTILINFIAVKDQNDKITGYIIGGTDISERKVAELRMKESEERFRLVADSAPVMIWMCSADNKTTYVNKFWKDFTGGCEEELFQKGWNTFVHPADAEEGTNLFNEHFVRREPVKMFYRLRNKNGEYRWVMDMSTPRILEDGSFLGYIGTVVDIHDQKLIEDVLREQANILENVSDIVISTDCDFNIVSWNKAAEDIYGVSAKDAIGNTFPTIIQFDFAPITRDQITHELRNNRLWKGEVSFVDKKGNTKYLLITSSSISDRTGKCTGYLSMARDISERKIAEQQLQQSELFYRNLIGDSLDGIIITDGDGTITFVAPSISKVLGFEVEELIGMNAVGIIHPDDREIALDAFTNELNNTPKLKFIVSRLPKKNGGWLWCMIRGHNLLNNQYVKGVVIYFHDDTLRKQAEDDLKVSEAHLRTAHEIAGLSYIEVKIRDGRILYSAELGERLETSPDELPADINKFFSLIPSSDRDRVKLDFRRALKKGGNIHQEFKVNFPLSGERVIQAIGYLDNEIEPTLRITVQNVTSIRRAQLALVNSESRFSSLFQSSIDGILLTQAGGTVRSANPAICELLGYTEEEVLRKKRWDIFEFNDLDSLTTSDSDSNGTFKGELLLIHKTGRRIACEVSSVLFQDSEGRSFHSTIVRDITRQKETEEEVKKRELILSAIAEASYRLLLEEEIDTAIEYSLQLIGKIVHADRVYVFENSTGSGEAVNAQLSHEWCAPDIASQQGENENRTEADYMFYIEPLRKNKFFSAVFSELKDPQLRQRWQEQHISSLLILPILMHGEVWGFVGFDECHYERQWTTWEIDILRAFASSLGGAIQRRKNEANLSATNIKLANAVNDLSKIMDYSMDVICSFNENGEFIQVSAASEKVWGYKADEVIGKKITDFIPKDDFENASDLVGLMKGGESVSTNFENRFRRKDGTHVFLEWSAYWYEKERIAFCVARDITLQKEIEKQLVASETRFRAFMNNSPACSWIADEDGILMYLNKTSIETLPVEYDDIGKNIFALFPKEVAASFHQNNLSVLMMNKPAETIENVPFKNGTTGTILVYLFPIQFEEKKGRRIVGCVAIDITSKTRAEEALRSSERNLKAIFSSTKDAFYLLDKDLVIKSYNKVASKLFQSYSNSNNDLVTGTSVLEIIRPDRRPNFENQMMTVLNGQSISYEIAVEINGGAVWCQVQAEPVIANNVVEGICLSIADVTSKKSAEEKIKQTAEQLTSIMETISDGMFILKNDFTVQYMNRSAEELLEVKRKHFIGKGRMKFIIC